MKNIILATLVFASSVASCASVDAQAFATQLILAGPVAWSAENEQAGRTCLLHKMQALAALPPEVIEEGFQVHGRRLHDDESIDRVGEAIKSVIICGLLFEHPSGPASDAGRNLPCSGLFFEELEVDWPKEDIEYMIPLWVSKQGVFTIRWRFKGYVGPGIPSDWGLRYFERCKKDYRQRSQVGQNSEQGR